MRMTNKIMQNNSLYNINNNKVLQDKLSTMMSTQKKITRPSDDPVIAIRALRLRTSVSELTQYQGKNAPDAESWLTVTEKALGTVTDVLTDMSRQANKAANKDYGAEDLEVILGQLKALRDEFYSSGNSDYAGRYIFTGYRTDTPLSFTDEVDDLQAGKTKYPQYTITEQKTILDFDTVNYTNDDIIEGMNKNNYGEYPKAPVVGDPVPPLTENAITNGDIHRLRLSYDDLKSISGDKVIEIRVPDQAAPDGVKITKIPVGGIETVSLSDTSDPYQQALAPANSDKVFFVPQTGELLFGANAYKDVEAAIGGNTNAEIRVTYEKDTWQKGDLRPEHYFACSVETIENKKPKKADYNREYLTGGGKRQTIEYDVGYNQKIQINTTADEVFGHNLDRDIEDLERALEDLKAIDATKTDMENLLKGMEEGEDGYGDIKKRYEVAEKAYSYIRENMHTMFENFITKVQGYIDDTNVAATENGTRSQRLNLISNRLMDQKTTFRTLQSENEDVDIAEVVVQLTSTELTYNAALMATGKIMQTSLMNYI